MNVRIQVVIETERQSTPIVEEIANWTRGELSDEVLGMSLAEAKDLLGAAHERLCAEQVRQYLDEARACPHCGHSRSCKGYHVLAWQSPFGTLKLDSPRLYRYRCEHDEQRSFSPLAYRLPERTSRDRTG